MIKKANRNLDSALHIYKFIDELPHLKNVWVSKSMLHNYLHAIAIIFKRFCTYFDPRRNFKLFPENFDLILYINSKNTYNSLSFLQNDKTILFEQSNRFSPHVSELKSVVHDFISPPWVVILSIFCFPWFAIKYWGKVMKYPNLYFENWGKDYVDRRFLERFSSVKKVVFANDHNVENRLFKSACKQLNIETIYLQHASVTKYFPKLDFDKSFLFGEIDLKKYRGIGEITGEIYLVGSPKFDALYPHRKKVLYDGSSIKTIGLAINKIDATLNIYNFIEEIINKTNYNLILRTHPGEERKIQYDSERLRVDKADLVKLTDFFCEIDFLLAGESSIHLESIYTGVPSCYVNLSNRCLSDNYDFIKTGLLRVLNDFNFTNTSFEKLALEPNKTDVIKRFLTSYDTVMDGRVSEIVRRKIFD